MADENDAIIAGTTVVIEKLNYMRTHLLNPKKNLQLGRDLVRIGDCVGHRLGTTFRMVPHTETKSFQLEVADQVTDFESMFLSGGSGQDNRDLVDDEKSQKLSKQQIEDMRSEGVSGTSIVEKLIENSDTFQNKTKFSQAKFLKKKARKYHQYLTIRKPTIRLLMQISYKADPMKLMNLRVDSLAQILNMTNVHSGGRYLVYETGAQGLVVAAALERVGREGQVVHIYQTGQPQTQCLSAMNYSQDIMKNLDVINIQHLRSLKQGKNILEFHRKPNSNSNKDEPEREQAEESEAEPPCKKPHLDVEAGQEMKDRTQDDNKPFRMNLRQKSVQTWDSIKEGGLDGLIIVCKQHPANLLLYLAKFLSPSRPFAVYSPYKEPLMESYMAVKDAGVAVQCNVSESWLRQVQVLPGRTHPEMLMSGGGGYLLTGIIVQQ